MNLTQQAIALLRSASPGELGVTDQVVLAPPELVTRETAAAMLGVSVRTVNDLVQARKLRSIKMGGRRLFRPAHIREYVESLPVDW